MNKLFKGMLATFLAVGFLAGCGTTSEEPTTSEQPVTSEPVTSEPVSEEPVVVKHWVTFWSDTVGGFYAEEEVVHGETVTMPEDPTKGGYTFDGWYLDKKFEFAFVPATPITKALDIYAKFTKDYVPDTRVWHLIGDFANTDYDNNWDTSTESYDNTIMTKDEDSNLFSIEIEIGWMGKFKAKVHGEGWASGEGPTEFDYTDFAEGTIPEYVVQGDTRNIQFTTAGLYKVEIETDLDVITVERLGDAVGEGVKPDPDPNAVLDWGMVGTVNNWGNPDTENDNEVYPDIAPEYVADPGYHVWKNVYLEEGAEIKFRTDNSWGVELGYTEGVTLPEGITMQMEGEAGAETPKAGGNLLVETTGFYAFTIQKVEEVNVLSVAAVGFALRGTATVGGWDADSETLALVDTTLVEEVTTYTYEGTFDLLAGEFKVKTTGVGPYNGWDNAFGPAEGGNFTVAEAGSYTVTLVVTFDEENAMFVGDASFAPAVEEPVVEETVLDVDTLALDGVAYDDSNFTGATAKVYNGINYGLLGVADYGNGLQWRQKSASSIWNETAFPEAIASITINYNNAQQYPGKLDLFTSVGTALTASQTEGGTSIGDAATLYTVTTEFTALDDVHFFRVQYPLSGYTYSAYVSSIVITFHEAV